jgi:hypothetical protein
MTKLLRPVFLLLLLGAPFTSHAAELSPWMGNEGQAPFQLDPTTMVAVTFAADPLQTGSTGKRQCTLESCATKPMTAMTPAYNP